MLELEDNFKKNGGEFKLVKLKELFSFKGIKQAKSQNLVPSDRNGIPYVVQSSINNMVKRTVNKDYLLMNDEPYVQGNVIALGVTLPCVSYQKNDFGASQIITARASFLNPKNALYFVTAIKMACARFSYTQKPGIEKYKELEILIPYFENEKIAFDYMEQYIRELEAERIRELEAYLKASGLNDYNLTEQEKESLEAFKSKDKAHFAFHELFNKAKAGDVDLQIKHVNGKGDWYINTGIDNQGIVGKTDMKARVFSAETLTIDMFGLTWYRDFPYKLATHAHVFSLASKDTLSQNCLLYLVGAMRYLRQKFHYNNMCNWNKFKNDCALLPINGSLDPDYKYMDTYIWAIKKEVIKDLVAWKDRELAAIRLATSEKDTSSKIN